LRDEAYESRSMTVIKEIIFSSLNRVVKHVIRGGGGVALHNGVLVFLYIKDISKGSYKFISSYI
jgi:hypothetical protein